MSDRNPIDIDDSSDEESQYTSVYVGAPAAGADLGVPDLEHGAGPSSHLEHHVGTSARDPGSAAMRRGVPKETAKFLISHFDVAAFVVDAGRRGGVRHLPVRQQAQFFVQLYRAAGLTPPAKVVALMGSKDNISKSRYCSPCGPLLPGGVRVPQFTKFFAIYYWKKYRTRTSLARQTGFVWQVGKRFQGFLKKLGSDPTADVVNAALEEFATSTGFPGQLPDDFPSKDDRKQAPTPMAHGRGPAAAPATSAPSASAVARAPAAASDTSAPPASAPATVPPTPPPVTAGTVPVSGAAAPSQERRLWEQERARLELHLDMLSRTQAPPVGTIWHTHWQGYIDQAKRSLAAHNRREPETGAPASAAGASGAPASSVPTAAGTAGSAPAPADSSGAGAGRAEGADPARTLDFEALDDYNQFLEFKAWRDEQRKNDPSNKRKRG